MKAVLSLCLLVSTVFASPFLPFVTRPEYDVDQDTQVIDNGPYKYGIQRSPYGIIYSIQYTRPLNSDLYGQQTDDDIQQLEDAFTNAHGHGIFGREQVLDDDSSEELRYIPKLRLGAGVPTSSAEVKETTTKKSKKSKPKKPSKFDKVKPKDSSEEIVDPIVQIDQIKSEFKLKRDDLVNAFLAKSDDLSVKYEGKFKNITTLTPEADTQPLLAEYQLKFSDLMDKYQTKITDLITKYETKLKALQTPDITDEQVSLDTLEPFQPQVNPAITTPSSQISEIYGDNIQYDQVYDDAFQTTDNFQTPLSHSLSFEHPSLKLSAVAPTSSIEATTKTPTIADVYWKSFGAKIKDTFNKTKTVTVPSTSVSGEVGSIDGTAPVPSTTPLPATFYKTFGKTISKSFADAKAKIMVAVKTTTVAPTGVLSVDGVSTPTPSIADLDPTFWDDFGKQIEDVFNSKAVIDAMKLTTTAASTEVDQTVADDGLNQQSIDLDYQPSDVPVEPGTPVSRKLKLGVGSVDGVVGTPVPTIPGIYWKTFGDKIKESFNKSKTVTTDSTISTDGVTPAPAPVLPPTFWMSFGKSIATALNNAKFKLISATKPTTPGALITDPSIATTASPILPIDEVFWDSFSKELDAAIMAKAMLTTTVAPLVDSVEDQQTSDDLQQLDYNTPTMVHDLPVKAKLFLAADEPTDSNPAVQYVTPIPAPGAFWKNYGGQIAGYFINAKGQLIPSFILTPPTTAPITPTASGTPVAATPTAPGLYWKSYGDSMAGHFITSKGQILDAVSKIKPTFVPYIIPPLWGQTQFPTDPVFDDSIQTENLESQDNTKTTFVDQQSNDFSQESSHYLSPKKNQLYLSAGSDSNEVTNPGLYWPNYGQNIKDNFVDTRGKIKEDINKSKFEQPIFSDDLTNPSSIPEKQISFWSNFRQRIQDNLNKAKARVSEFTG